MQRKCANCAKVERERESGGGGGGGRRANLRGALQLGSGALRVPLQ